MYIPALSPVSPEIPTSAAGVGSGPASQTPATELRRQHQSVLHPPRDAADTSIARLLHTLQPDTPQLLRKRNNPLQATDVTIGAVVGVLLGVFILGTVFFCVRYHRSIRFADKRRRRRQHHHHHRSGGSKTSTSSASTAPAAAAAAAPPAPPPEEPAAG